MTPDRQQSARTGLWQAVKKAQPHLADHEVDELLARAARQERDLVLNHGLSLSQARELANRELFPENLDPWAGDEEYGPMP
jgi:hypothetical protein